MKNRLRSWASLWVACCGLMTLPVAASAESVDICHRDPECRKHSKNGVRLSEKKDYAEALQEFEAAYAIQPDSRLLINIGRSLYRLNRPKEALDYYARYRKAESDIDPQTDKALKGYEADAIISLPPAEAATVAQPVVQKSHGTKLVPALPIGLIIGGAAFLAIGIGLGSASISAGNQIADHSNNFTVFNADSRALESRGMALESAGITFDVLGGAALTAGAVWTGLWLYQRKTGTILIGNAGGAGFAFSGVN